MGRKLRDITASHITDPAVTTSSGDDYSTASGSLVTDLTAVKTAVDAILVALENIGELAKA